MALSLQEKIKVLQGYLDYLSTYTGRMVSLSAADLTTLAEIMTVRTYDKKSPLVSIGEQEQYLHFVIKGLIRKYFYRKDDEIIIQLAKEGDMISSTASFFGVIPSDYTVEAIEVTTVLSLPRVKMEQLYRYSIIMNKLARVILTEHVLQHEHWELNQLRYNIRERFQQFVANNQALFLRVPHKYQASYLNIKPETFSRLKAQLIRKVKALSNKK